MVAKCYSVVFEGDGKCAICDSSVGVQVMTLSCFNFAFDIDVVGDLK